MQRSEWIAIVPAAPRAADALVPDVHYVSQKPYHNLCWAAAAKVMFENVGVQLRMEEVVAQVSGATCRQDLSSCDHTAWPQDVYHAFRCTIRDLVAPMSAGSVRDWNEAQYAVQAYLEWSAGGSHTVVIVGTFANGDVRVFDSLTNDLRVDFGYLLRAYSRGRWTRSWWQLANAVGEQP